MSTQLRKAMGYGVQDANEADLKGDRLWELREDFRKGTADPTYDFRLWAEAVAAKGQRPDGSSLGRAEATFFESDIDALGDLGSDGIFDLIIQDEEGSHDALLIVPPSERTHWIRKGDDMDTYEFEHAGGGSRNLSYTTLEVGLYPYQGRQDITGKEIDMPYAAVFRVAEDQLRAGDEWHLFERGDSQWEQEGRQNVLDELNRHARHAGYEDYDAYVAALPHPVIPLIVELLATWTGLVETAEEVHRKFRPAILSDWV